MAGLFDDIPAQPTPPAGQPSGMFDDITPAKPADTGLFADVAPASTQPGIIGALVHGPLAGLVQAGGDWAKTIQSLYGRPDADQHVAGTETLGLDKYKEFEKPLDWSLGAPNVPKIVYQLGKGFSESAPALAAGIGAGAATVGLGGGPENPLADVAAFGTGSAAFGAVSALQQFGPYYANALKETPNDPDGAWSRALKQAAADGAISATAYAAFGYKPFASKMQNLLFQALGVQPAIGVAGAEAQKQIASGENITPGEAASAAFQSAASTLPMGVGRSLEPSGRRAEVSPEAPVSPPAEKPAVAPARAPENLFADIPSEPAKAAAPPADIQPGAVVGVKGAGGEPMRATVRAVEDGLVHWVDDSGRAWTDDLGAFKRDLVQPPAAAKPAPAPELRAEAPPPHPDDFVQRFQQNELPEPTPPLGALDTAAKEPAAKPAPFLTEAQVNERLGLNAPEPERPTAPAPIRLSQWLKRSGGITDIGGDLKAMDLSRYPGLIRKTGRGPDDALRDAIDQDFLPAGSTVDDLRAALYRDLSGNPVYSDAQRAAAEEWTGYKGYDPDAEAYQREREALNKETRARLAAAEPEPSFTVYHGSPHEFDQFDISKIGTGEGAQAYGHGLYFAESPGVAEYYRDALSGLPPDAMKKYGPQIDRLNSEISETSASLSRAQRAAEFGHTPELRQFGIDTVAELTPIKDRLDDSFKNLWNQVTTEYPQAQGNLYKARISGTPADFIDLDKTVSQQSPAVRDALLKGNYAGPDAKGLDVIRGMSPETQMELAKAGIRGTTYLDQGSRGKGEGSRNYVVFNPEHVTAVERNGQILPGAAGEKVAEKISPSGIADGIAEGETNPLGRFLSDESGSVKIPGLKDDALKTAMRGVEDLSNSDPLTWSGMSKWARYTALAQTIAAKDRASGRYLNAIRNSDAAKHALTYDGATAVKDYLNMSEADRAQVDKYFEYMTMTGMERPLTGRPIVFRTDPQAFGDRIWPLQLSKPGETVRLTPKQTAAAEKVQGFLADAWKQMAEANARRFGYDGPMLVKDAAGRLQFDFPAMRARAMSNEADKGARKAAERALGFATEAQNSGRGGAYFPLARYGDWRISVVPKVPKSGEGFPLKDEGTYIHVDGRGPFDALTGAPTDKGHGVPKRVQQEIARLKQQYPEADFHYKVEPIGPRQHEHVDLQQLGKLLENIDTVGPDGKPLADAVMEKLYQERLAGFRKPRDNVPGYSTDFPRAVSDYIRSWAGVTSRMLHGNEMDAAYEGTQTHKNKNVRDYWEAYKRYNDRQEHVGWGLAKRVGFYNYLWARPVSAAIQLMQTPIVTGTQHAAIVGPIRAEAIASRALVQAMAGVRAGKKGLELDVSKLPGLSDAERAEIVKADRAGRFNPTLPADLAGGQVIRSPGLRKVAAPLSRVYDMGASGFNVADRANRVAAWLSSYRIAQNPAAQAKIAKVYGKDAYFREAVGTTVDPVKFANWMTDETQFLSGRMGSSPLMRGPGSLAFQFQHYNANMLRLLHKNFTKMGPEGKAAGLMMIGSILGASGLMGFPMASDAEKYAETLYKLVNDGVEPRWEAQVRELIANSDWGRLAAHYMGVDPLVVSEMVMEGPSRQALGMDLGRRVGLGNLMPGSTDIISAIPLLSSTVGKAQEFERRWRSGQPWGAMASLLPAGFQDPLKAYGIYPEEGVSTQTGGFTKLPSQITPQQKFVRAMGATPASVARAQESAFDQRAIENATKAASQNQLTQIAREYTLAMDAQRNGDAAGAARHQAAAEQVIRDNAEQLQDPSIPMWQKIPPTTATQIRNRIFFYLSPEQAAIRRAAPMKRPEMMQSPYLTE